MNIMDALATLENLQDATEPPESDVGKEEVSTQVADASALMESDYKNIEDTDTGIADGEAAIQAVDSALMILKDVNAQGDAITGAELQTMESLMGSIHHHLGLPPSRVTMESFQTLSRTDLVETMENAVLDIGAKILAAIKAAFDTVIGFLSGLFRNKMLLGKYLASLKARLNEHRARINGSAKVDIKGLNSPKRCKEALSSASSAIKYCNAAIGLLDAVESVAKSVDRPGDTLSAVNNYTQDKLDVSKFFSDSTNGDSGKVYGLFSGNKGLSVKQANGIPEVSFVPLAEAAPEAVGCNFQDAVSLVNDAITVLNEFSAMKKFENRLVAVYRQIASVSKAAWNGAQVQHQAKKGQTLDQEKKKKALTNFVAVNFRKVTMNFGARIPKMIFGNIADIGKYIDGTIKASSGT